jgi:hypothetical protein
MATHCRLNPPSIDSASLDQFVAGDVSEIIRSEDYSYVQYLSNRFFEQNGGGYPVLWLASIMQRQKTLSNCSAQFGFPGTNSSIAYSVSCECRVNAMSSLPSRATA